jgi:hypothetical protein
LNKSPKGIIERLSWKAIVAGIVTFLGLYFGLPEYVLNVRPQLERTIGSNSLCFIEGAISSAIIVILVLKFLSRFQKPDDTKQKKKTSHVQ